MVNCHLEGNPYRAAERVSQIRSSLRRLVNKLVCQTCNHSLSFYCTIPQTSQKVDPSTASVVVLGDLNGISSSCAYRLLAEGRLPAGATEPYMPGVPVTEEDLDHPFAFVDAYRGAEDVLPFTFKKVHTGWMANDNAVGRMCVIQCTPISQGSGYGSVIDFILHTDDLQTCGVLQPLANVQALRVAQRQSLPNQVHPSDHLPVGAVLVGRTAQEARDGDVLAANASQVPADRAAGGGMLQAMHAGVLGVAQPRCFCGATR